MAKMLAKMYPKGSLAGQQSAGVYVDKAVLTNYKFIKKGVLEKDGDFCEGFFGDCGTGKTTLSFQHATYFDNNFDLSKVVFTPSQFLTALKKAEKGDCIVFDEAMTINSRSSMSEWNRKVINIMASIRSKNLFILFNLPQFFDLDRNLALSRMHFLIHCYSPQFAERGYYNYYFGNKIKQLFMYGKKYYSYKYPAPNGRGRFTKAFLLNKKKYELKKQEGIHTLSTKIPSIQTRLKTERDNLIKYLREKKKMRYSQIAEVVKTISDTEIGQVCRGVR